MKVKKEKKLVEDEAPQEEVKLDDASTAEIAADIEQGAEDANKTISPEDAAKEAAVVDRFADIIVNPYGTARVGKIEKALQRSLESSIDNYYAGMNSLGSWQNVIIYGLAGFGKTSIVKKFCKDHNLNLFECDAKSLDIATVGGIPYPKVNPKTGEMTQAPINSSYWDGLKKPNTILFLDELNRTSGKIRGSLLTLINEHQLPGTIVDPNTGEQIDNVISFPNILFTVIAINPADDVFTDNEELDPAMVSRNPVIIEQGPDIKQFLGHLTSIYEAIASNKFLAPKLQEKYAGQFEIAKAILTDKSFSFDDADDVRNIFFKRAFTNKNAIGNYLNYRTFLATLLRSNGKKKDYLSVIEDESGFQPVKVQMIKNILATYTDKVTTGNNVFNNQNTNPARAAKAAVEIGDALGDYLNSL